ncbi:Cyclic di-GMP phosphodiesterase Gmr [compost metagenome]
MDKLRLYGRIFKKMAEAIMITDIKGCILSVNPAFTITTGYSEEEALGQRPRLLHSGVHDSNFYINMWAKIHETGSWQGEIWNRRKNGEVYPEWLTINTVRDEKHKITNYVGIFSDISERKRTESKMELQARVFETASEGIMITDTKGHIISVNPAFVAATGFTENEALQQTPRLLHSGKQDANFYIEMWAAIHEKGSWQGEIWNRRKNGDIYPEWLTINAVRNSSEQIVNYVGIFTDITERKHTEERLKYLAHMDVLTGLPNRYFFHDTLNQSIREAKQENATLALMFVDLDHFKMVNDTLGHSFGDLLLQRVSQRLSACVREQDTVSRLGGDEFTIILPHLASPGEAIRIVENIITELSSPIFIHDMELFITASIGISLYPYDGCDAETLLKNADTAMYQAKDHTNSYQLYKASMNQTFSRRMQLENGLHKAIEKNELYMVYQPQMNVQTGEMNTMEALLRWNHGELGEISPNEFIPIAEDNGLIIEIGEWVLRTVCEQNIRWQNKQCLPQKVAVNLSPRQFRQRDFVEKVEHILLETGLAPCYLSLEITESISIHQVESTLSVLQKFKRMGIEVAIDDFGKGHSALSYLKKYPINTLKIDKCFVQDIDPENKAIIKAIIDMAHGLHLQVIAEGVETKEQFDLLKSLQCDYIQGYWLCHPLLPEKMEHFFSKSN